MENPTDDDDSEFFESAHEILSTASGEEDGGVNQLQESNGSQIRSRLSIWRNNPGTILERRQRLLLEMDLDAEMDSDFLPLSPLRSLKSSQHVPAAMIVASPVSSSEACKDGKLYMMKQDSRDDCELSLYPALLPSESIGDKIVLENIRVNGVCDPSFLPSVFHKGQNNKTGMQVRTVSLESSSSSSMQNVSESTLLSYPNVSGRIEVKHADATSFGRDAKFYSDCTKLRESSYPCTKEDQKVDQDSTLISGTNTEIICRIKNLDSGKEFIVNEVRKDGLWNKLKELDTGRELTLEEFESSLGFSPIMKEVMRRERAAENNGNKESQRKKIRWLKTIKSAVIRTKERSSQDVQDSPSDGRDDSSHNAKLMSGFGTDDSQEAPPPPRTLKRIKVYSHKKSSKELTELHMRQEFQAHEGAIWTMKFSIDGNYLASAGQDGVVHVWEVLEQKFTNRVSPDTLNRVSTSLENGHSCSEILKKGDTIKGPVDKRRNQAHIAWPSKLFSLSQKPKCSFYGHTEDVLDLSWSRSQLLLSSSMDKTVRLWHISHKECLRVFKHHDYVTCIDFNPVNNGYFISGSLDDKVRIWSIEEHQVVDWADLREMVTAASYTPDGKGAVVGSYKGTCRFYDTSGHKLQLTAHVEVRRKKRRKSQGKKITGFQFIPGECSIVLITSSDSRIRVYDGAQIIRKYKGFRNAKSQISASFSPNGRYIISASEDSHVYIWTYSDFSSSYQRKKTRSGSYEKFCSKNVLLAIPWPGMEPHPDLTEDISEQNMQIQDSSHSSRDESVSSGHGFDDNISSLEISDDSLEYETGIEMDSCHHKMQHREAFTFCSPRNRDAIVVDTLRKSGIADILPGASTEGLLECNGNLATESDLELSESLFENDSERFMLLRSTPLQVGHHSFFSDGKVSATWPEEKLPLDVKAVSVINDRSKIEASKLFVDKIGCKRNIGKTLSAWGLVIVTAGLGGEIRTFQNYGFPLRP